MLTVEVVIIMILALAARFMVPKMMYSDSVRMRFAIGCGLFAMYIVVCIAMFHYLCCYSYNGFNWVPISDLTGQQVWDRVVIAFMMTNLAVLFGACVFYFTRDKRRLSQKEKLKLKDL